jgi:hypothetical protein
MPNVLVVHSNGATSIAKRSRAIGVVDAGRAYWRDPAKTVLIMLRSTDDRPNDGYEYGGKRSYSRQLSVDACDLRTRQIIKVPVEQRDKTQIPVREPGGAKVMQLKPLVDRRTTGQHIPKRDRLWRPDVLFRDVNDRRQ